VDGESCAGSPGSGSSRSFTTGGDAVVCELAAHGQGQGSGVPVEWTTFAVLQMRNGKITRAQAFLNRADALEAAGLSA
jgi:ketosteroid isomerase-like protein